MIANEKEKSYTFTGYTTKVRLNEDGDIVISQSDDCEENMFVVIGYEHASTLIKTISMLIRPDLINVASMRK